MPNVKCQFLIAGFLHYLGIGRQREQREVLPVEVIHQIKHAGKTRAREIRLIPRPVLLLSTQQVGNAASH
jgi:hypothetical protein